MTDAAPRRETQLDGLRCLAFLAVFFFHAEMPWCRWGWAGVAFFFSLSGFLITRVLVRSETGRLGPDLRRFYWRRTLRIFPLYYGLLLGIALSGPPPNLPWYLLYLSNIRAYLDGSLGGPLSHFWTLAVEEQFYILYPLLLLRTPARWRVPLVLGLVAASKGFQVYTHLHLKMPVGRVLLPYCGEDLLWGCLAGLVDLRVPRGGRSGVATALVLGGVPVLVVGYLLREKVVVPFGLTGELLGVSLLAAGNALVVVGAWRTSNRLITATLSLPPLVYLGKISYGLYAFHMPVLVNHWVLEIPYGFLIPRPWGDLALTVGLAALSWRFWERPINDLKDQTPRQVGTVAVAKLRRIRAALVSGEAAFRVGRRKPG